MSSPPRSPPATTSAPQNPPDVLRSRQVAQLRKGGRTRKALKRHLPHGTESFTPQRSKVNTTLRESRSLTEPRPSSHSRTSTNLGNALFRVTAKQAWNAGRRTKNAKQILEAVQKSLAENNNSNNGNRPNNNVPNVRRVAANQQERQLGQIRKKTAEKVFLMHKVKPRRLV